MRPNVQSEFEEHANEERKHAEMIAKRIIELEGGQLRRYSGNYSDYLEKKALREEAEATTYERQAVTLVPADVGDFQLQVFGEPALDGTLFGDERAAALALGLLAVLDEGPSGPVDEDDLDATVRGASADHYLLWVHDAAVVAPLVRDLVINPGALTEGMNLAIGFCRPGRPSQLLIVPPERITITARDDIVAGACLDVFWGDWR